MLRDRHCTFPACRRPPLMCHAHHIRHWADGGETHGDRAAPALVLGDGDRDRLERLTRSSTVSAGAAQRARIVLLAADGVANDQICELVGCGRQKVLQWRGRYESKGLAGLADQKRPGRPRTIDHAKIVTETLKPPPKKLGGRTCLPRRRGRPGRPGRAAPGDGQLRRPQARQRQGVAHTEPAVRHPLHPDPRVLDEPGRGLVLPDRTPSHPPWRVHLGQGPQHQDPHLHRRLERPLPPVRLDQNRRRHPHQGQPDEDFKSDLDNLALLCGHHHRTIHHSPWQIRLNPTDR